MHRKVKVEIFVISWEMCRRAREARSELLAQHCVVRAGCMRAGDNMVGSLITEFPFLLPGVASTRQGGSIVTNS